MTSDFEVFRRERNIRRQQGKTTFRPEGNRQVWEEIEEREANELKDEILNAECDDFFADATRLAATIVQRVSSDRQRDISAKLRHEMEEFLCDSIRHATNMIINLDWEKAQTATGEETFEPNLKNLDGRRLDEFRAEGTAQLDDRHLGQDPFGTALDGAPSGGETSRQVAPARSAPRPTESIPLAAQISSPPRVSDDRQIHEQDMDDSPIDLPADGAADSSPCVDDTELIDPSCLAVDGTEFGMSDAVPRRMRLRDDELSVAFETPDPTFEAEEFGARIAGVAPIQRATMRTDDEEDEPLAAMFVGSGSAQFDDDSAIEASTANGASTVEAREEVDANGAAVPPSINEIRDALRLLVRNGIMSPEQARAAFRKQTAS